MHFLRFLFVISVFLLGACGGGSSSNGNLPDPVQGQNLVLITEATAEETAGTVLDSIDGAFDASESALGFGGAVGARVDGDTRAAVATAIELADRARDSVTFMTTGVSTGAVISETQDCTDGGMSSVSINTGDLSEEEFTLALQDGGIPAGVSISTEFADCREGDSVLNGSVTLEIESMSLEGELGMDTFVLAFRAVFDDFTAGDGSIDGDISLSITSAPGQTDVVVSGDRLAISVSGELLSLLDFDVSSVEDTSALVETFDFTLSISSFGNVTVETVETWRTLAFAEEPISGVLRIIGAGNGSITVTALDEMSVQLEIDEDGDGTVDATIITTWDELDA
jgi:hypothetical protein